MNKLVTDIFGSDFDKNVEVEKRSFDGKFNLWRRDVTKEDDGSFTMFWETIGVFDGRDEAFAAKDAYRKKVSNGN